MTLFLPLLLGCVTEPPEPTPDAALAPEAQQPTGTVELLGWPLFGGPRSIPGLRPGGSPADFRIDPEAFHWAGPPIVEGRVRFAGRRLVRATLTAAGRSDCDEVRRLVGQTYDAATAQVCSEDHYETDRYAVRYHERPDKAQCIVTVMVGQRFDPPAALAASLADGELQGHVLGDALDNYRGLVPIGGHLEGQAERFTLPGGRPRFEGVVTHGLELRFWRDELEEIVVRSTGSQCATVREALVTRYGPGVPGQGTDLLWRACDASLQYKHSEVFDGCAVLFWSPAHRWDRAEWLTPGEPPEVRARQAEVARFVVDIDGRATVTSGIFPWIETHPEFASEAAAREPAVNGRSGETEGFRLVGIKKTSVLHALGLRDRDWIVRANEVPAHAWTPAPGLRELDLVLRRGGREQQLRIGFDEGVYDRLLDVRKPFP